MKRIQRHLPGLTWSPSRLGRKGIVVWKLLVAVFILGVGAFLAKEHFDRRAIRAEQEIARTMLRELGEAMRAHHDRTGLYTTDLVRIGFAPTGRPRYVYGFTVPYYPPGIPRRDDYRSFTGYVEVKEDERGRWDHSGEVHEGGLFLNPFDLIFKDERRPIIPQANDACFLAAAVADLDGDPALDHWTIDCELRLTHVFDDVTDQYLGAPPDPERFETSLETLRARLDTGADRAAN